MPKVQTPPNTNRQLVARIKYGMELQGISPHDLALTMRTSTKTVYERFKHPEFFRLDELRRISQKIHISLATLLGGEPQ